MQSNMKDIQKDMLLYWSGEADETTMRRVTECLERDPRTRSYLEDLHEMDTEFKSSKKNIARGVPTRRKGLLDEVLSEAVQVKLPTNYSEQPQSRWASLSFTSTVAAAFTVLAAVYSLLIYSNNLTQEISKNQPPSSQKEIDDIPYVDRMTLSKQLLEPSVSFRRNGDGLVLMRSHRARHQKIRTTPYNP